MDHNELSAINVTAFDSLDQLETLDLSYNQLTFVDDGANKLSFIESAFMSPFNLKSLKQLNLRNNSIVNMVRLFSSNIEYLDLSYNNLSEVSNDDFIFGESNTFVNVSHNRIANIKFIGLSAEINDNDYNFKTTIDFAENPVDCDCQLHSFLRFVKKVLPVKKEVYNNIKVQIDNLRCAAPSNLAGKLISELELNDLLCPFDSPITQNKYCPAKCDCMYRVADKTVIADCSNAKLTSIPSFAAFDLRNDTNSIELNIENNEITQLEGLPEKIVQIHAANNQISSFDRRKAPKNMRLTLLDLQNNTIARINQTSLYGIAKLSLSGNPLICDCQSRDLLNFVKKNLLNFTDYEHIGCQNIDIKFSKATVDDFCSTNKIIFIAAGSVVAILGLIFGLLGALYYKYNHEIKVWLYAHNWCLWFVTEDEVDKGYQYDAFISFSQLDEEFVAEHLVPELEHGINPYKLCLHMRDWIPGEFIPRQVRLSD